MKDLIVFIGESGSGKNFLLEHLAYIFPQDFHIVPQCTTRPMRMGEEEGNPYHFITKDEFLKKIPNDILEFKIFNNWYYGTCASDLVEDKINILSANPAAARDLAEAPGINTQVVYVHCNAKTRLIRQLEREIYPDIEEILRRYWSDKKDYEHIENCYYIENNNLKDLKLFETIVKRELEHRRTKMDN